MLCVKVYFIILIYYSMTVKCEVSEQMISNIMKHVRIIPINNLQIIQVFIDENAQINISMNSFKYKLLPDNISTVEVFHIALNCAIADWTLNAINDYKNSLLQNFEEQLNNFVSTFSLNVEQLIELLNNFLDSASNEAYYKDTSVFKALLSLQLIVNLFPTNFSKNYMSEDDIFRTIIKEMTSFQSFLSMNCTKPVSENENSHASDFWIREENVETPYAYPFIYFSETLMNLSSNYQLTCMPTQTVLLNFLEPNEDETFFVNILDAHIVVDNGNDEKPQLIPLNDVSLRVKTLHDVDTVFWYQDMLITTIVKTVFWEILKLVEEGRQSEKINELISAIAIKIFENKMFPSSFDTGFKILCTNMMSNPRELLKFYNSLTDVELTTSFEPSTRLRCLHALLKKLLKNMGALNCFKRHYDYLFVRCNKYYLPLAYAKKIISPAIEMGSVFDFLVAVYCICENTLGPANNEKDPGQKNRYVISALKDVRNYFLLITEQEMVDTVLMQTAYDVASVLANVPMLRQNRSSGSMYIKWIIDVIIMKLTAASMHYCTWSYNNCFLHGYRESYDVDIESLVSQTIEDFFQVSFGQLSDGYLTNEDMDYYDLSVEFIYNNYLKDSTFVNTFDPCVVFIWRGEENTLKGVFEDVKEFPVNLRSLVAVYDVCFKFYVSVVYCQILNMLSSEDVKKLKQKSNTIEKHFNFNFKYFSSTLKPLVIQIKLLLKFIRTELVNYDSTTKYALEKYQTKIELVLSEFNVTVDCPGDHTLNDSRRSKSSTEQFIKGLMSEVNLLNNLFINITTSSTRRINIPKDDTQETSYYNNYNYY